MARHKKETGAQDMFGGGGIEVTTDPMMDSRQRRTVQRRSVVSEVMSVPVDKAVSLARVATQGGEPNDSRGAFGGGAWADLLGQRLGGPRQRRAVHHIDGPEGPQGAGGAGPVTQRG